MKRVVTNTTLLALLATLLLLAQSGPPGALGAAPERQAVAGAMAAGSAGLEVPAPDTDAADPSPAGPPTDTSSAAEAADTTPPHTGPTGSAAQEPAPEQAPAAVPEPESQTGGAGLGVGEREEGEEAPDARGDLAAEGAAAPTPAHAAPLTGTDPAAEPPAVAMPPRPEELGIAIDPMAAPLPGASEVPLSEAVAQAEERQAKPLKLLHGSVPPGTYQRLSWSATELFEGVPIATPVLVVNGSEPGPTLCLTAAIHGDELNGIEMVRRVMHNLDPRELSGAVIGVPIVNLQGFRRASRYLPDRRDLNRYFPGNPQGSQASRIAFSFFTKVMTHCDALVDLHTGSFERANLPQLRADLRNPDVVTLTQGFGATVILHSEPADGTLRFAATRAGIPAVTLEAGGPSELELKEVMHGVKGVETLLNTLGMIREVRLWGDPEPVYYQSTWVRANSGGILLSDVSLGSTVERGDLLGTITDPMSNASTKLFSPYSGRIIGMARNQVVMPGFAAFHVGIQTAETTAAGHQTPQDEQDESLKHESEESNQDYIDGMSE
jgi:uncharacterized protein